MGKAFAALLALATSACTTVTFTAPRPLFEPETKTDAVCESYPSEEALFVAVGNRASNGWREMQTGTSTTSFLGMSSTTTLVCYERARR